MEKAKKGMAEFAVVVDGKDPTNCITANKDILMSSIHWHKIFVYNDHVNERDFILQTIMNFLEPHDFVPMCYTRKGGTTSFLVHNCADAIARLCNHKLVVANPKDKDRPFKLGLILGYTLAMPEINVSLFSNLQRILRKRYNATTKTLNLDSFHKDPDLIEYTPLSQPRLLRLVLDFCKTQEIVNLRLSNNDIRDIPNVSVGSLKLLTCLDLRNNKITTEEGLAAVVGSPLTSLHLDGNPICDKLDKFQYVRVMKRKFIKLEKLDGFAVLSDGFLVPRRNFVCDVNRQEFVDQFLEHFFPLFDSKEQRHLLNNMYHNEAYFSLSLRHISNQKSSNIQSLKYYDKLSKQITVGTDSSTGRGTCWQGTKMISSVFKTFPNCEHNRYTFTVDLMYFSETAAVIVVTGVFREHLAYPVCTYLRGFTRTFVLVKSKCENEYLISNDQLHISNAMNLQENRALKLAQWKYNIDVPQALTTSQQEELIHAFESISGLNALWSKGCVEACSHQFKQALDFFIDMYRMDWLPKKAFVDDPLTTEEKAGVSKYILSCYENLTRILPNKYTKPKSVNYQTEKPASQGKSSNKTPPNTPSASEVVRVEKNVLELESTILELQSTGEIAPPTSIKITTNLARPSEKRKLQVVSLDKLKKKPRLEQEESSPDQQEASINCQGQDDDTEILLDRLAETWTVVEPVPLIPANEDNYNFIKVKNKIENIIHGDSYTQKNKNNHMNHVRNILTFPRELLFSHYWKVMHIYTCYGLDFEANDIRKRFDIDQHNLKSRGIPLENNICYLSSNNHIGELFLLIKLKRVNPEGNILENKLRLFIAAEGLLTLSAPDYKQLCKLITSFRLYGEHEFVAIFEKFISLEATSDSYQKLTQAVIEKLRFILRGMSNGRFQSALDVKQIILSIGKPNLPDASAKSIVDATTSSATTATFTSTSTVTHIAKTTSTTTAVNTTSITGTTSSTTTDSTTATNTTSISNAPAGATTGNLVRIVTSKANSGIKLNHKTCMNELNALSVMKRLQPEEYTQNQKLSLFSVLEFLLSEEGHNLQYHRMSNVSRMFGEVDLANQFHRLHTMSSSKKIRARNRFTIGNLKTYLIQHIRAKIARMNSSIPSIDMPVGSRNGSETCSTNKTVNSTSSDVVIPILNKASTSACSNSSSTFTTLNDVIVIDDDDDDVNDQTPDKVTDDILKLDIILNVTSKSSKVPQFSTTTQSSTLTESLTVTNSSTSTKAAEQIECSGPIKSVDTTKSSETTTSAEKMKSKGQAKPPETTKSPETVTFLETTKTSETSKTLETTKSSEMAKSSETRNSLINASSTITNAAITITTASNTITSNTSTNSPNTITLNTITNAPNTKEQPTENDPEILEFITKLNKAGPVDPLPVCPATANNHRFNKHVAQLENYFIKPEEIPNRLRSTISSILKYPSQRVFPHYWKMVQLCEQAKYYNERHMLLRRKEADLLMLQSKGLSPENSIFLPTNVPSVRSNLSEVRVLKELKRYNPWANTLENKMRVFIVMERMLSKGTENIKELASLCYLYEELEFYYGLNMLNTISSDKRDRLREVLLSKLARNLDIMTKGQHKSPDLKNKITTSSINTNTLNTNANITKRRASTLSTNTSSANANTSTENANTSTENANTSTENANTSTENANTSTENATISTENANTSTENANTSTSKANTSTHNLTPYKRCWRKDSYHTQVVHMNEINRLSVLKILEPNEAPKENKMSLLLAFKAILKAKKVRYMYYKNIQYSAELYGESDLSVGFGELYDKCSKDPEFSRSDTSVSMSTEPLLIKVKMAINDMKSSSTNKPEDPTTNQFKSRTITLNKLDTLIRFQTVNPGVDILLKKVHLFDALETLLTKVNEVYYDRMAWACKIYGEHDLSTEFESFKVEEPSLNVYVWKALIIGKLKAAIEVLKQIPEVTEDTVNDMNEELTDVEIDLDMNSEISPPISASSIPSSNSLPINSASINTSSIINPLGIGSNALIISLQSCLEELQKLVNTKRHKNPKNYELQNANRVLFLVEYLLSSNDVTATNYVLMGRACEIYVEPELEKGLRNLFVQLSRNVFGDTTKKLMRESLRSKIRSVVNKKCSTANASPMMINYRKILSPSVTEVFNEKDGLNNSITNNLCNSELEETKTNNTTKDASMKETDVLEKYLNEIWCLIWWQVTKPEQNFLQRKARLFIVIKEALDIALKCKGNSDGVLLAIKIYGESNLFNEFKTILSQFEIQSRAENTNETMLTNMSETNLLSLLNEVNGVIVEAKEKYLLTDGWMNTSTTNLMGSPFGNEISEITVDTCLKDLTFFSKVPVYEPQQCPVKCKMRILFSVAFILSSANPMKHCDILSAACEKCGETDLAAGIRGFEDLHSNKESFSSKFFEDKKMLFYKVMSLIDQNDVSAKDPIFYTKNNVMTPTGNTDAVCKDNLMIEAVVSNTNLMNKVVSSTGDIDNVAATSSIFSTNAKIPVGSATIPVDSSAVATSSSKVANSSSVVAISSSTAGSSAAFATFSFATAASLYIDKSPAETTTTNHAIDNGNVDANNIDVDNADADNACAPMRNASNDIRCNDNTSNNISSNNKVANNNASNNNASNNNEFSDNTTFNTAATEISAANTSGVDTSDIVRASSDTLSSKTLGPDALYAHSNADSLGADSFNASSATSSLSKSCVNSKDSTSLPTKTLPETTTSNILKLNLNELNWLIKLQVVQPQKNFLKRKIHLFMLIESIAPTINKENYTRIAWACQVYGEPDLAEEFTKMCNINFKSPSVNVYEVKLLLLKKVKTAFENIKISCKLEVKKLPDQPYKMNKQSYDSELHLIIKEKGVPCRHKENKLCILFWIEYLAFAREFFKVCLTLAAACKVYRQSDLSKELEQLYIQRISGQNQLTMKCLLVNKVRGLILAESSPPASNQMYFMENTIAGTPNSEGNKVKNSTNEIPSSTDELVVSVTKESSKLKPNVASSSINDSNSLIKESNSLIKESNSLIQERISLINDSNFQINDSNSQKQVSNSTIKGNSPENASNQLMNSTPIVIDLTKTNTDNQSPSRLNNVNLTDKEHTSSLDKTVSTTSGTPQFQETLKSLIEEAQSTSFAELAMGKSKALSTINEIINNGAYIKIPSILEDMLLACSLYDLPEKEKQITDLKAKGSTSNEEEYKKSIRRIRSAMKITELNAVVREHQKYVQRTRRKLILKDMLYVFDVALEIKEWPNSQIKQNCGKILCSTVNDVLAHSNRSNSKKNGSEKTVSGNIEFINPELTSAQCDKIISACNIYELKDLVKQIEDLKKEIEDLKKQIEDLKNHIEENKIKCQQEIETHLLSENKFTDTKVDEVPSRLKELSSMVENLKNDPSTTCTSSELKDTPNKSKDTPNKSADIPSKNLPMESAWLALSNALKKIVKEGQSNPSGKEKFKFLADTVIDKMLKFPLGKIEKYEEVLVACTIFSLCEKAKLIIELKRSALPGWVKRENLEDLIWFIEEVLAEVPAEKSQKKLEVDVVIDEIIFCKEAKSLQQVNRIFEVTALLDLNYKTRHLLIFIEEDKICSSQLEFQIMRINQVTKIKHLTDTVAINEKFLKKGNMKLGLEHYAHLLKLLLEIQVWPNQQVKLKCSNILCSTIDGILKSGEEKSVVLYNDMIKACGIYKYLDEVIKIQDLKRTEFERVPDKCGLIVIVSLLTKCRRMLSLTQSDKLNEYTTDLIQCEDLSSDDWRIICDAEGGEYVTVILAATEILSRAAAQLPAQDLRKVCYAIIKNTINHEDGAIVQTSSQIINTCIENFPEESLKYYQWVHVFENIDNVLARKIFIYSLETEKDSEKILEMLNTSDHLIEGDESRNMCSKLKQKLQANEGKSSESSPKSKSGKKRAVISSDEEPVKKRNKVEKAAKERPDKDKLDKVAAKKGRTKQDKNEKARKERKERETLRKERAEQARLEKEAKEKSRKEKAEYAQLKKEERDRARKERLEKSKKQKRAQQLEELKGKMMKVRMEMLEKREKAEKENAEKEKVEREKVEREKAEKRRLEEELQTVEVKRERIAAE